MNQPTQETTATPYKTQQDKPLTKYDVEKNGDVKITQTVKTVSWWTAREYLSLLRGNEDALNKTRVAYSEEQIQKMKDQEKEILGELEIMKPIMEKAEEFTKKQYEKDRHEGLKKSLLAAIEEKEIKDGWWQNVWLRTKHEIKDPIFRELTQEQQSKVLKALQHLKRKGIK